MAEDTTTTTTTATPTSDAGTTQQTTTTGTTQQNATTTAGASVTSGAPEAYVWAGQDGKQLYEPEAIAKIEPIARDLGLTQEQALKFAATLARYGEEDTKSRTEAHQNQLKAWAEEVRNDPKLGGANFDSTIRNCGAMLDKLAVSDADKAFFKATGIGMHPAMVRLLHGVHEKTSEDSFATTGTQQGAARLSDAEVFYGKK